MPLCGLLTISFWVQEREPTVDEARSQHVISTRFAGKMFKEAIEARHDGAIVQLLSEKRYGDAEDFAQFRYYSRVLLLSKTNSSAVGNAMPEEVGRVLSEARERWRKHQYVMPDENDHERLVRLMR